MSQEAFYYWFNQGLSQGMTEDQAADFADSKFEEYV
jgi:hypothetical protein